jgi:aminopeptidase YwaD
MLKDSVLFIKMQIITGNIIMFKKNLEATLDKLLSIGPRAPGSWKELEAAEFINTKFESFGYDSQIKTFSDASHNATDASLEIDDKKFYVLPTQFSAPGEACGELIYLGNCSDPFHLRDDVKGKIGVLFSSENFEDRLNFLLEIEANGMLGIIVISSHKDNIETKSIRFNEIKKMPIAVCSWDTGNALADFAGSQAHLKINWCETPRDNESQNVIATLPGTSPYWMAVTAHHDSAAYAPGAMDNGGGTSMLVELARNFADKQFPVTIYFVSTGSEENGGMDCCGAGSKAFFRDFKDQLDTCIGHIEIDDIGNKLGIPQIFYRGNKTFTDLLFDEKISKNYKIIEKDFFSCDNGISAKYGLPFIWFTDAVLHPRPWYHTPDDTKDKMCLDKCAGYFEHIGEAIEKLANTKPFYPYIKENDLLIRPARYEDLNAAKAITKAAFGPVSTSRMNEDFFGEELGNKPWHVYKNSGIKSHFDKYLNLTIVCEKAGTVVGYATFLYHEDTQIAEIGNNAVHPDYQGQGIGKAMQREVNRRMNEDGFTRFTVQTLTCDIAAQKIYEKLGYKKIASDIIYLKK